MGLLGHDDSFIPRFLRSLYIVFHSDCINLHSYQQCKIVPFPPHPLQHFIVCRLFDDGHSDQCEVISHCSFDLHFSDNERCWASFHVLAICMSSLEKCLFKSFSHFLIGLFVFLALSCMSCFIYSGNQSFVSCFI